MHSTWGSGHDENFDGTEFSVGTTKISGYPGERELQFGAVLLKHVPLAHSTTPTDATMTPVKLVPGSKGTAAPL
jgi:hypothetical protein